MRRCRTGSPECENWESGTVPFPTFQRNAGNWESGTVPFPTFYRKVGKGTVPDSQFLRCLNVEEKMDELTKAKKKALDLLTDMDRTEKQLFDKLKKAGFSDEIIAGAMAYVKSFGYVNDRHFATRYIEVYRQKRSRRRVLMDLKEKGIPQELIDEAVDELGYWDERPLMRQLAEKKLRSLPAGDPGNYRKVAAFLGRQGFSTADVIAVCGECCRESVDGEE